MKKWLCILAIAPTLVDFTRGQTVGGTDTSRASWQNPSADGVPPVFPVGKVTPFSEGGVSLQPYQRGDRPSAERQWAKLSERGDAEALRAPAFAAFLSNESGQRILAMTWISTWIDSEGTTHQYVSRYDTLLQGGAIFPKEVDRLLISSSYHSVSGPNPKPAGFSLSNLLIPPTLNNLVDFDAVALSK